MAVYPPLALQPLQAREARRGLEARKILARLFNRGISINVSFPPQGQNKNKIPYTVAHVAITAIYAPATGRILDVLELTEFLRRLWLTFCPPSG